MVEPDSPLVIKQPFYLIVFKEVNQPYDVTNGSNSVAHFSCLKFFAKNEKNDAIFREKRKIHEKYFFTVFLWNYTEEKYYLDYCSIWISIRSPN